MLFTKGRYFLLKRPIKKEKGVELLKFYALFDILYSYNIKYYMRRKFERNSFITMHAFEINEKGMKFNMEKTIVYLIRHSKQCRDCYNFGNIQSENEKIILSVEGEKEAEELSNNPELLNIDQLWSSSYSRAIGTAKYIAKKNNILINIDKRLNERRLRG